MRRWISRSWASTMGASCSTHRDRDAVAALVRRSKDGRYNVNMRYYCQECLDRKLKRDPKILVY